LSGSSVFTFRITLPKRVRRGDYAGYPGPILVLTVAGSVIAALAIGYTRRFGWIVGIGVVVVSWLLYALQETVGLPGLSRTRWEPTRLMSLAFSALFVVVALRELSRHRR
jgi:hypothetical protein